MADEEHKLGYITKNFTTPFKKFIGEKTKRGVNLITREERTPSLDDTKRVVIRTPSPDNYPRSSEKGRTIEDEDIPEWMKARISQLVDFAVENGGERPENVGKDSGFYHVHLLIPNNVSLTGKKEDDWDLIQKQSLFMLAHTQEFARFDLTTRSIIAPLRRDGQPEFLSGGNEIGTVKAEDLPKISDDYKGLKDRATIYFRKGQDGNLNWSATLSSGR